MPLAAWIILVASLGALTAAFCAEYGFDIKACELCYWQRVPFGVTLVLATLALLMRPREKYSCIFLGLASFTFLVSTGLALFHTGVEQHWWSDAVSCAIPSLKGLNLENMSIEEARNKLLATDNPVPCDEITWSFLGLSMANWNILFSLGLAIFSGIAAFVCSGSFPGQKGFAAGKKSCCFCRTVERKEQ